MRVHVRLYSKETNPPPPIPSTNALIVDPPNQPAPRHPPASAIYDNLHTNLPKNVMAFRDIPFPDDYPLFPSRKQVIDYIQDVAEKYDLLPMIRFNTTVLTVQQPEEESDDEDKRRWRVSITHWHEGKETNYTETFDAIVVANGKYYVPYIPNMDGLKEFSNVATVLHSQNYRRPKDYKNKVNLFIYFSDENISLSLFFGKVNEKKEEEVNNNADKSRLCWWLEMDLPQQTWCAKYPQQQLKYIIALEVKNQISPKQLEEKISRKMYNV